MQKFSHLLLVLLASLVFATSLRANVRYTWTGGGGSDLWSDTANWSGNSAPPSAIDTETIFDGTNRLTPTQNSDFTLNTIDFSANAGAFTLSGTGMLNLRTNSDGLLPSIVQASAADQIIRNNLSSDASLGVYAEGSGTLAFTGVISGSVPFVKQGPGTAILTAANTYAGTIVNAGILKLDFSAAGAPASDIAANGSMLQLNGGGLLMQGNTNTASQTFSGLNVTPGADSVSVVSGSGGTAVLNLGTITRYVGGTINFLTPASGSITTTNSNTNGILGGYALFAGNDWAMVNAGTIAQYTGYTANTWAAGNNTTLTTSNTVPASSTTNSLRFSGARAITLTLSGTNIISSGGLLVGSGVGNNLSQLTGGSLTGASSADLVVYQNNTGNGLTIGSAIVNNGGATSLTKGGPGLLTLTGASSFTGLLRVYQGTLTLAAGGSWSNPLANGTPQGGIIRGGATLNINGSIDLTNQELDISTNVSTPATVNLATGGSLHTGVTAVGYIGTGVFNQTGGTHLTGFVRMSAAYSGSIIPVSNGTYNLSGGQLTTDGMLVGDQSPAAFNQTGGTASVLNGIQISGGATYTLSGTSSVSATIALLGGRNGTGTLTQSGGTFTITGNPADFSGYLSVGDSNGGTYQQNGGNLTTAETDVGYDGTGVFNQNAGAHTISNGGTMYVGYSSGSLGTYNLNGGVLQLGSVAGGDGVSVFNFNSGVLQAGAASSDFLHGLTSANVRVGGVRIDTNGFDITINQTLNNSAARGDFRTDGGPAMPDGGLIKYGLGTLTLTATESYNGLTNVSAGTLKNLGSLLGNVEVSDGATLTGTGRLLNKLTVDAGGLVTLSAGTMTVDGGVTNYGTMRFDHGASLTVDNGTVFVNHGLLDIISGSFTAPAGFSNDGIVLDANVVRAKQITRSGGTVSVSIDAYPAHTYQLQRSTSPNPASFTDVPNVPPQTNPASASSAVTFTFTDPNPLTGNGFYRLRVDP